MAAKTSTGNLALNLNEVLQTYHNMKTTYIRAANKKLPFLQLRSNQSLLPRLAANRVERAPNQQQPLLAPVTEQAYQSPQ